MTKDESRRERMRAETELSWAPPKVSFALLTDAQVMRILRWVRAQIRKQCHASVPGSSFIVKERRINDAGRTGWRWVVCVGPKGEESEVSVHTKKQDAFVARRNQHAVWWAQAIADRTIAA